METNSGTLRNEKRRSEKHRLRPLLTQTQHSRRVKRSVQGKIKRKLRKPCGPKKPVGPRSHAKVWTKPFKFDNLHSHENTRSIPFSLSGRGDCGCSFDYSGIRPTR